MSSNLLRILNKKYDQLLDNLNAADTENYSTSRDEEGNLIVKFDNEETIKIPIFRLRPYQIAEQKCLFINKIKRHLYCWPRRAGKEVYTWNALISAAIEKPGLYLMVYPYNVRARAVLWEGAILMPDGESLSFLNMIPKKFIISINNQEMKVKFSNGSIIWLVGSDIDVDKLRGINARGAVFCEFSYQDPRVFYTMLPIFRQNGGWLICQSTFDGQNHFYQLMKRNKDNPLWNCKIESVETLVDEHGERYITDAAIEEDRQGGMPEYLIQQEYYSVVQVNQETKYFALAMNYIFENEKIVSGLILPNKNLYTAWDIGMNDNTFIIFFQIETVGNQQWPIVIGYFESNNKPLAFYIDECRKFSSKNNLYLKYHFIPHDGKKRDFTSGQDVISFGNDLGENFISVPRPASKINAIESCRRKLNMTRFNKENCQRVIDCLCNYSKKYNEKLGVYKDHPVHDWASHGVDAYQTMTLALDFNLVVEKTHDIIYYQ